MGIIDGKMNKVVGGKTVLAKNSKTIFSGGPPWKEQKDVFFPPISIESERAGSVYPYRLLVFNVITGEIVGGASGGVNSGMMPEFTKKESNTGGIQYTISKPIDAWVFTLPITPQQLSITDQFAINTTATMRGVVEEHNGIKFKIISASGTTGIWPTRTSFEDSNPPGLSLFGGTLSAIGGAVSAFNKLTTGGNAPPTSLDPSTTEGTTTGYYQALLLQQFLEQYAIAKKDPNKKGWRLIFDCPKTNESFVVTPIQYNVTRSQRSPGEFIYNMQFKAWKRIDLKIEYTDPKTTIPLDVGFFQKAVNTLDNTRSLMSASLNVIQAVRADYRQVFDQVRKVSLLVKDLGGIAFALCDFPNQLIKDVESAVRQMASDINSTELPPIVKDTVDMMKALNNKNEGMSQAQVKAGVLGKDAKDSNEASSTNKTINNPEGNYEFFKLIDANSLKLDMEQKNALQDEAIKNAMISIQELKEIVNNLRSLVYDLSNSFGAGDTFISTIYNKPSPKERATPMTLEEFELIRGLEEVVTIMLILTATRDLDDSRKQNSLEYVGGLANDSSIPFDSTATAKILVPVPYNLTIEQISARYLGDPDRYNEIITLNNLRSPYIDENGFFYNLLSNGDGRQFNINSKENLYVSQKIQLFSNTIPMFTRKIIEIEKITDTNYLITVDGLVDDENDLKKLKVSDNAKIKAYLPGTVNSQNQIYIPSDQTITEESRTYDIPFLKDDTLTSLSKIDWLLDENGDVIIDSFGEISLANGTTNLIQALKMKIVTQKGTLLSNPEFGLGLKPGISVADADIQNILKDLRDMVTQDPRFEGVENIELNILPPEVSITINAKLINGNGIFPINFSV
jgi:hypothetical protein